ncbi:hypothetical protein ABT169_25925 [Streptomyces sp. NPDC001616]|uniref:hypothetical protein n=1 Tax=Streptomyces sp. NPDC001616 TaxID=3156648 RepID=UPI00332A2CE7
MQTDPQLSDLQLSDFLTPSDIEVRMADFGYEDGTAVVWLQDTWTGPGNPSTVRSGVVLRCYLEGEDIGRTAIEGATDLDDPKVKTELASMQLHAIATHGQRYLAPVRDEIDRFGDPQHLIARDDLLRDIFYRRVQDGRHAPKDLELIAEVEAKEAQLTDLRRRYAVLLWRYLAHLYRHGMTVTGIARWTQVPASTVERRISSVPTAGAAAITGVEQKTWSAYVTRGQAPAPDDYVGREPVWHLSTVLRHINTRPGRPGRPSKRA